MTSLLTAPLTLHYLQRLPALTAAEVALYADQHGVLSNVTPDALHWHADDDGALAELAALRFDWQAPWDAVHGIQPPPGALGLSVATLECVVSGDGWLRWVRIGQRTPWGRFVQVMHDLRLDANGHPHYETPGEGVWQVGRGA